MTYEFKIGGVVWRGYRYWADDRDFIHGAQFGWNTQFAPYRIVAITAQRIVVEYQRNTIARRPTTKKEWSPLFLNRATMEREGKQYHTRYHEYFYAKKPKADPEHEYQFQPHVPAPTKAMTILNLSAPYSVADVRRAYKRLALQTHPDLGGNSTDFIKLKQAHDDALRFATGEVR